MTHVLYDFLGLNKSLFIYINSLTNVGFIPNILQAISEIFFIANFAIGYIVMCLYFYIRTRNALKQESFFISGYFELTRIGICYTLFGLTFAALKFFVNMPRPFCSLKTGEFITIADTSLERCLSSFPSAHTGLSILVTYCLWSYMNKTLKSLSCAVILAVATARITLAMHYPTDIIYSALVTIGVILTGNLVFKIFKNKIIRPIGNLIYRFLFSRKKIL